MRRERKKVRRERKKVKREKEKVRREREKVRRERDMKMVKKKNFEHERLKEYRYNERWKKRR